MLIFLIVIIDHLLLCTNNGLNISYGREDSAEYISIEKLKAFKSGVILDALLVILKLSESRKCYDVFKFYDEMVTDMVSSTTNSRSCQIIEFLTSSSNPEPTSTP